MKTGTIKKCLGLYIIFLSQLHLIISAPRKGNPDEWGSEFQGDIKIPRSRNGLRSQGSRWPNGIVPYEFGTNLVCIRYNTPEHKKPVVLKAMETYHNLTDNCIQFVERTDETDFVVFVERESGCWSYVGKIGGRQEINYPQWCIDNFGSALHELYHCLGFLHEQSRPDRDDYVEIVWDNIKEVSKHNFNSYGTNFLDTFEEDYDYGSIMHYSPYAFAIDYEEYTIKTKASKSFTHLDPEYQDVIGQRKGLSDTDLQKLLKMYNCPNADS
ncbi:Low choriolytic enzyme [Armadillidium vulgare]|nr:Low choriolytic enzyme [Armadillidium vulgare]